MKFGKSRRSVFILLLLVSLGTQTQLEANGKVKKKATVTKRACGAKTLPSQPGDLYHESIDVDRDGTADLVVHNKWAQNIRIAFANGPEVSLPIPESTGRTYISFYRFIPDTKAFGLNWYVASVGFRSSVTTLHRRSDCEFTSVLLPSEPNAFHSSSARMDQQYGPTDELRCDRREIFRLRYSTPWGPETAADVSTVSTWKYSYKGGIMSVLETPTIDVKVPGRFKPTGDDCFTDPIETKYKYGA